ncbi:hypothetical protein [Streptomyces subrutilus]|uniref:Uncharacterized protein n=1 Tax=Streptomyces subrutilus TaxID=36818 RepID=A0A1E5NXV3_9ACTN|nr:hypothetical protein [Streptomyces subrutilus]OEJ21082.1 hypothetical protein BGK67_34890 [Streptomyces subrutilus]
MNHEQNDADGIDEMLDEEISAFETGAPPWDALDPGIVSLVRAFSRMPGIITVSSCEGHPERDGEKADWHIGWKLRSADAAVSIIDAGPHPEGWLLTEWLLWHANDLGRAGYDIIRSTSIPAPFLNFPGRALTFWVHGSLSGEKTMSPDEYLASLRETWEKTGYGDLEDAGAVRPGDSP